MQLRGRGWVDAACAQGAEAVNQSVIVPSYGPCDPEGLKVRMKRAVVSLARAPHPCLVRSRARVPLTPPHASRCKRAHAPCSFMRLASDWVAVLGPRGAQAGAGHHAWGCLFAPCAGEGRGGQHCGRARQRTGAGGGQPTALSNLRLEISLRFPCRATRSDQMERVKGERKRRISCGDAGALRILQG